MNAINFGDNRFCGPSVISSIAGINTDESEKLLQRVIGNSKPIKAVWPSEIRMAFKLIGYETKTINVRKNTSLLQLMYQLNGNNGFFVIEVSCHVIAIEIQGNERFLCDTSTRIPLTLAHSARLGDKIISCFKVERVVQ